jgi:hypothetical protein
LPDVLARTVIDDALNEIEALLRGVPTSPAIRELRVRHGGLSRVVRGWMQVPAHESQIAAMLDCVLELHGQVLRTCALGHPTSPSPSRTHPSALHIRTTRPPPRRDPSMRTTRPPPARHSDTPPSSRRD